MAYTTDDLLKSIKQKAFIPTSQITFKDDDILNMATNELYDTIVPLVLSTREEFYVTYKDYAVAGQASPKVDIPDRAIGLAVREVSQVASGQEANLVRFDIEDLPSINNAGVASGFYLQGNQICVLGSIAGNLRVYFHVRPGALIKTTGASKVTSISGNTVTVSALQNGWSNGASVDFIRALPGFDTLSLSTITSTPSGTSFSVDTVSDRLAVGDWVCTDNTSPVPQIPVEFFSYLAQLTAVQVLDALGDTEAKNSASAKLEKMEANALSLITPRVVGESKKVVPYYNKIVTTSRGY